MRIDGIEIDDEFTDSLLTTFGAEPEDFTNAERRRQALALLLIHGLELLEEQAKSETPGPLKADIERSLLALAGSPHLPAADVDERGQAYRVWLPGRGWLDLPAAPAGWMEQERLLTALRELLVGRPELRVAATARRLPTNEEITEISFSEALEPVVVEVRLQGRRYRFRLDPASVLVSGMPMADPELVVERR